MIQSHFVLSSMALCVYCCDDVLVNITLSIVLIPLEARKCDEWQRFVGLGRPQTSIIVNLVF